MGKANRERRRMKEKTRKRQAAGRGAGNGSGRLDDDRWSWLGDAAPTPPPPPQTPPPPPPPPPPTPTPTIEELVSALVSAAVFEIDHPDGVPLGRIVEQLTSSDVPALRRALERDLDQRLRAALGVIWQGGWQPADLLRVAARRLRTAHHHLLRAAIAAELAGYAPTTIDPSWSEQLAEGEVTRWWPGELTAVQACAELHPDGWPDFVTRALELLHLLAWLPRLELLGPAPGTATPAPAARRNSVDERILARVRALLAKAESTNYPAEAETFTAGAQALMARHSIDHALLAATGRAPADHPTGRRIGVDNPYEAPKATLLDAIASANRCRSVWSKELGFCTVVGFPTDLDIVEVLFTSLLVQATTAMTREGSRTDRIGRSRTRSFRQSFLLSYAHRIQERLSETTRQQTESAAAEPGRANLLPVLASRTDAVEQATCEMFPHLTTHSAGSAWDREGWASGRAAADLASLTPAAEVTG
jgi:hypothetical protein